MRNQRILDLLQEELNKQNFLHTKEKLPQLSTAKIMQSAYRKKAETVFESLQGIKMRVPEDMNYHLQYRNLLIQYDDELHFNRYRKISLEAELYEDFKGFKLFDYKSLCRKREQDCLKVGLANGFWHNSDSEKLFGESEEEGDLSLERNGSSAWKYRAWRDYLQDLSSQIYKFHILRISAFDTVFVNGKLHFISDLLKSSQKENYAIVAKALIRRIINVKGA